MKGLNRFEHAVLDKLLAGDHAALVTLRAQAQVGHLVSREYTGAGFFLVFDVPTTAPILAAPDFHFGDVTASVDGLENGAGFVIFVRGGRLDSLEGYTYEEPWPQQIHRFTLDYIGEPRQLDLPEAGNGSA